MASVEKLAAAAAEVLGAPVSDVVRLSCHKKGGGAYFGAAAAIYGVVVFLHEFGVIPGPTWLVYLALVLPLSLLFQMAVQPVFAALTPTGIQMTSSGRWILRPAGPQLGPLDPAVVSGPHGRLGQHLRHRRGQAPDRDLAG